MNKASKVFLSLSILSSITTSCLSPEEQQKLEFERQERQSANERANIDSGRAVIISIFTDPIHLEQHTTVGLQYSIRTKKTTTNLITVYKKDNADVMIETDNKDYPLLYVNSDKTSLKIGDTLLLEDKNGHFDGKSFGLSTNDQNNEEKNDPRGVDFGKPVIGKF